jgi:hypothetical protein
MRVVGSPKPDRSVEQEAKSQATTLLVLMALILVAMVALTSLVVAR